MTNTRFRSYLDCNVAIGRRSCRSGREICARAEIGNELRRAGVSGALAYHCLAKEYHAALGNQMLTDEIADDPSFLPCWVLTPDFRGDSDTLDAFVRRMHKHRVRAVRIFPKTHIYPLLDELLGPWFAALAQAGICVLVEREEITLEALTALLKNHPALNIILTDIHWRNYKTLLGLMARYPNLHVELSQLQVNHGIEGFVEARLHRQLVFGSGFPTRSVGAARACVEYTQVSDTIKDAIAWSNLARLLGRTDTPAAAPAPDDPLVRAVACGSPLHDFTVIDAHAHLLHDGAEGSNAVTMPAGDAAGLLATMRRIGIDHTCLSSWRAMHADVPGGNQDVLDAVSAHPAHFSGYLVFNPWYQDDLAAILGAVERNKCLCGFKPYQPITRYPLDGPLYQRLWSYADQHESLCLLHLEADAISSGERLIKAYPRVRWIIPHAGQSFEMADMFLELAQLSLNVFLDITHTNVLANVIEYLLGELGADRLLFGTDTPMRDVAPQLGWLAYSRCSLPDRLAVLGRNMSRLLGLDNINCLKQREQRV